MTALGLVSESIIPCLSQSKTGHHDVRRSAIYFSEASPPDFTDWTVGGVACGRPRTWTLESFAQGGYDAAEAALSTCTRARGLLCGERERLTLSPGWQWSVSFVAVGRPNDVVPQRRRHQRNVSHASPCTYVLTSSIVALLHLTPHKIILNTC